MFTQAARRAIGRIGRNGVGANKASIHCLKDGQPFSVERRNQVLRVLSGKAWLTFDGKDFVLERGQKLRLSPGRDRAVISGLGSESLLFDMR